MKQQFTIQAITDCTIEYKGTIEYSIDNGKTWKRLKRLSIKATHEVQFRNAKSNGNDKFIIEGNFNVYGHISTLAPYGTEAFMWLFYQTNVVDASKLILDYDELWPLAYYGMFKNCTSLTTAPELPATTLDRFCYAFMFEGCTSLTTAPELPAMTLAQHCYSLMFYGCTSLTSAPSVLPAMTLAPDCYSYMFSACTSLTRAPELSAITLAMYCYYYMFADCTRLTTAPELPATTLAPYCYAGMFDGCENLTAAPMLLAVKTKDKSYYNMFIGCKSLKKRPVMPKKAYLEAVKMDFLPEELI